MISHTTQAFRTAFAQLPAQVQEQAREAYKLFRQNPYHPSLRWKHVHPTKPIYSVRVGRGYRAVGIRDANIRIISARQATRNEVRTYERGI